VSEREAAAATLEEQLASANDQAAKQQSACVGWRQAKGRRLRLRLPLPPLRLYNGPSVRPSSRAAPLPPSRSSLRSFERLGKESLSLKEALTQMKQRSAEMAVKAQVSEGAAGASSRVVE
jgi:hypothetical protein